MAKNDGRLRWGLRISPTMPELPAKVARQPGVFSRLGARMPDALSALEDLFDLMLQLAAILTGHLPHSAHHGGQRKASEEVHDLLPLGALHRQTVDTFQKIVTHGSIFMSCVVERYLPKVR